MEETTDILGLLDLMTRPGFCVKDNVIVKTNSAAKSLLLTEGTNIQELISSHPEEYDALQSGCLYLPMWISGLCIHATVTKMGEYQVFALDQDKDDAVFNAMALIAGELRKPLDNVMHLTDQLLSVEDQSDEARSQTARLNRGLYQILRIVSNLSYPAAGISSMSVREVGSIVDEIMEKAQALLAGKNLQISYEGLHRSIYCLVDAELLERALLNLLSNAVKFTPEGGTIHVSFTLKGRSLRLQVQDNGSGIAEQVKNDLFYRYLRQPGIEDGRYGLGLGMVVVRKCAAKHGGVVLTDSPETGGTRITLTLAIRQAETDRFHSPLNMWIDYAGGRDHALVELSDCLTPDCYDTK